MSTPKLLKVLKELAVKVKLSAYQKHPRGPKKRQPKRKHDNKTPHVSMAKIIANRKKYYHKRADHWGQKLPDERRDRRLWVDNLRSQLPKYNCSWRLAAVLSNTYIFKSPYLIHFHAAANTRFKSLFSWQTQMLVKFFWLEYILIRKITAEPIHQFVFPLCPDTFEWFYVYSNQCVN